MEITATILTATVTLAAVALGGLLTILTQDRTWRRDHARQWRDIRLAAYSEFVSAVRSYIAFVLEDDTKIRAVPHPRRPGEMMPFFDQNGRPYRERLESAVSKARMIARSAELWQALGVVMRDARAIAAERAKVGAAELPQQRFTRLWASLDHFSAMARVELDLPPIKASQPPIVEAGNLGERTSSV